MKQKNCVGKFNEKDEYYTPKILTDVILPYVPTGCTVWCPFDTEDSEFVWSLRAKARVLYSHLWLGQDFFEYEPTHYDFAISNPPFTRKLEVLERLYGLGRPFAMVLPIPMLNYQEVSSFFTGHRLELLIPDKKVSYDGNTASFATAFFCSKMLGRDLEFVHLEHNNTGKWFQESRMRRIP